MGYLLYGGHVIGADLVAQMADAPAGVHLDIGIPYGLGTTMAKGEIVVEHPGWWNDIAATMMFASSDPVVSVAVQVPEPDAMDFGFEWSLASLLKGTVGQAPARRRPRGHHPWLAQRSLLGEVRPRRVLDGIRPAGQHVAGRRHRLGIEAGAAARCDRRPEHR